MEGMAEKFEEDLEKQKDGFEERIEVLEGQIADMEDRTEAVDNMIEYWRDVKRKIRSLKEYDDYIKGLPFGEPDDSKLYKVPVTVTPPAHAKAA
jgi:hypothetical protein